MSSTTTINGSNGNDTIVTGDTNAKVSAKAGNDTVITGAGNDKINAGSGNDVVTSGAGNDKIQGGSGNDTIVSGAGNDKIDAGSGNDTVISGSGNDVIDAGSGNDVINAGADCDTIDAGSGNDTIIHNVSENIGDKDTYKGGSGNDTLVLEMTAMQKAYLMSKGVQFSADGTVIINSFSSCRDDDDFNFSRYNGTLSDGSTFTFNLVIKGFEAITYVIVPDAAKTFAVTENIDVVRNAPNQDFVSDAHLNISKITSITNDGGLTVTQVATPSGAFAAYKIGAANLVIYADGTYALTQNGAFDYLAQGQKVTFSMNYAVQDSRYGAASEVVNLLSKIQITGVNDGPVAVNHLGITGADEDHTFTIPAASLLAEATDLDQGALLTLVSVSGNSHISMVGGNVVFNPGNDFQYLNNGQFETITFNYTIKDQFGATSTAQASLVVQGVNDAPVAAPVALANVDDTIQTSSIVLGNIRDAGGSDVDNALSTLTVHSINGIQITLPGEYAGSGAILASPLAALVAGEVAKYVLTPTGTAANQTSSGSTETQAILTIMADGTVTLSKGTAFDFLPVNENVHLSFNYTLSDPGNAVSNPAQASFDVTGLTNSDSYVAGSGGATLIGGSGDDVFKGGSGNDTYDGGAGSDVVNFTGSVFQYTFSYVSPGMLVVTDTVANRDGVDTLINIEKVRFTEGLYTLIMGDNGDNPALNGGAELNLVLGFNGNDALFGGAAFGIKDVILGGDGDDTFAFSPDGTQFIAGGTYSNLITGEVVPVGALLVSQDYYIGGAGFDTLLGSTSGEAFIFRPNDPTAHISQIEQVKAGAGNDFIDFSTSTAILNNYTAFGEDGGDIIWGGYGNDTLNGDNGNDMLHGGPGVDILNGGAGYDLLKVSEGVDKLFGGIDIDTVSYQYVTSGVTVDLSPIVIPNQLHVEVFTFSPQFFTTMPLTPSSTHGDMHMSSEQTASQINTQALSGDYFALRYSGYINITEEGTYQFFTSSDDGSQLFIDDQLVVDNDGLHATVEQSGSIYLTPGLHTIGVTMYEADGEQVLSASYKGPSTGDVKIEIPASALSSDFGSHFDSLGNELNSIENIIGSASNDTLIGNVGANLFHGGNGNDILDGRGGNDTLYGDGGNDTFIVSSGKDKFFGGTGSDKVTYESLTDGVTVDLATPLVITGGLYFEHFVYAGTVVANMPLTATTTDPRLTLVDEGTASQINHTFAHGGDTFALRFTGSIDITAAGTYTFYTSSDDGSQLFIDGNLVVDNGGLHPTQERSGTVTFTAADIGKHSIVVTMYELGGGENLSVAYEGPGIAKTIVPSTVLSYDLGSHSDSLGNELNSIEHIIGSQGNDTFIGSSNNEILDGGNGIDTVDYHTASSSVSFDLIAASSTVATAQNTGGGGIDTLSNIESFKGSLADDTVHLDTTVFASGGSNILDGGGGVDTLTLHGVGQHLNLTLVDDARIVDFEKITLTDSTQTLTLNVQDAHNLSSTTDTVIINGPVNGTVNLDGAQWSHSATPQDGYEVYTNSASPSVVLMIDPNLTIHYST